LPCLSASSAYSLDIEKKKNFILNNTKNNKTKTYVAYSLTLSAPCAKYSLLASAYSDPMVAASAAFSLRTSVASRTFS